MSEEGYLRIARSYFLRDYPILGDMIDGFLLKENNTIVVKLEDGRYYIYKPEDSSLAPYFA